MYSLFEVNGTILNTTENFYSGFMDFEITFSNIKQKVVSVTKDDDPTEVISYPIGGRQTAHLIKQ